MSDVDVLIVGAGPAGVACAETLRAEGFDGSILLAGREPDEPYERPPTSKDYLVGRVSREDCRLHPPSFYEQQRIDLRTRTSVMRLDPGARVATLASKEEVSFGRALLATGANVRRLRVDGATLDGIHYLRALGNADTLRSEAEAADRVVLVGGSYIACEVAASLTAMGRQCTLLMMERQPLERGFGARVAGFFADLLRSKGVEICGGESLARFEGDESGEQPRVRRVVADSGLALDADLVVMGTGAMPDVMLARAAGLELGESGGIACDASLRTAEPGIWAAGDVCEYESALHGERVRIEHWEVARAQGAHVARAMLGSQEPFTEVPYFWSDLSDWATVEYVGGATGWEDEVLRGSLDDGEFTVFQLSGDRVVGAVTVGRAADLDLARRLIAARSDVSNRREALAAVDGDVAP